MNVCRPKSWAARFYDKSENESNMEKWVKVCHNKLLKMNMGMDGK